MTGSTVNSHRARGKPKASTQFPTPWSDWEWNAEYQFWQRYRWTDTENHEWESRPPDTPATPRTAATTTSTSSNIGSQYIAPEHYTHRPSVSVEYGSSADPATAIATSSSDLYSTASDCEAAYTSEYPGHPYISVPSNYNPGYGIAASSTSYSSYQVGPLNISPPESDLVTYSSPPISSYIGQAQYHFAEPSSYLPISSSSPTQNYDRSGQDGSPNASAQSQHPVDYQNRLNHMHDVSNSETTPGPKTTKEKDETYPVQDESNHGTMTAAVLNPSILKSSECVTEVDSVSASPQTPDSSPAKFKSLMGDVLLRSLHNDMPHRCTITYDLRWELPAYLKKFFSFDQRLGGILTLTGGAVNAFGSSCEDYLKNMYPAIGISVLKCLEKMLLDPDARPGMEYSTEEKPAEIEEICWRHNTMPGASVGDLLSVSSASCKVTAGYQTHLMVTSILSWLCAAVRFSDQDRVCHSSVSLEGETLGGVSKISIGLDPLEPVESNGTCWHEVFHRGVIAKDFAIPGRKSGQGLEIPFADIALLCGCLGFVEYKEGIVADGLTSILIPRKRLLEDDAFQWHFERKNREGGRIAYTSDVLDSENIEPWSEEGRAILPEELVSKRCFLAWAEKANIMIGTEKYFNHTTIGDSHALLSRSIKYVRSYSLNLGGNVSHLAFGATIMATPTSMPSFFKPALSNGIYDILRVESAPGKGNHYVLVYDNDSKIGWYLPQACVVLHMAHHYLSQQKHQLIDTKDRETSLEFATPDWNIGAKAANILSKSLCFKTRRCIVSNSPPANEASASPTCHPVSTPTSTTAIYEDSSFKDSIERLWYLVDTIGSTLKMNKPEYIKCSEIAPKGIHGVDFNELLEAKSPEKVTSIRYIEVDQPWSYLTNDQSAVIFCKNFGQAIVPASKGLCNSWSQVPRGENYLAMSGQTIHYFLRKHPEGLSKELKWYIKKIPVQVHLQGLHEVVIHTQRLKSIAISAKIMGRMGRTNAERTLSNMELIEAISPQSCLLFTAQPGKECSKPAADNFTCAESSVSSRGTAAEVSTIRPNSCPVKASSSLLTSLEVLHQHQEHAVYSSSLLDNTRTASTEQEHTVHTSPLPETTMITTTTVKNPPTPKVLKGKSRESRLSIIVAPDARLQAKEELTEDVAYILMNTRAGSMDDGLLGGVHEQRTSTSYQPPHPQSPRNYSPLDVCFSEDEGQQLPILEAARKSIQQEDDDKHFVV